MKNTIPELDYIVHILSQFMQKPLFPHWDPALRVVLYLEGCPGQENFLRRDDKLRITAFCDADYNACPLTRHSLSAFIIFVGNSPISWKTKKRDIVSHSSAEAAYRAISFTLCELKCLKELSQSLGVSQTSPMHLFCDSQAAIYIAANPVFHERTKHIESDCYQVRDAVEAKLITTEHVTSKNQLADILTKALPRPHFEDLLSKLGIRNLTLPTWAEVMR